MNYVSGDSISILDDDQHMKNNIICTTSTLMSQNQSITTPPISSTSLLTSTNTTAASITKNRQRKIKPPKPIPLSLDGYWPSVTEEIKQIKQVDAKNQHLPLARIKKIMKLDENAKMIAAEAPLLFAKACEYFIQELTLRAWIHTEENKRRTLQRSDIATAISRCDQFDFLIDIVPREEVKQTTTTTTQNTTSHQQQQTSNNNNSKKSGDTDIPKPSTSTSTNIINTNTTNNTVVTDPIQYYLQLGGGQHITLQNPQGTTTAIPTHSGILSQSLPTGAGNQGIAQLNVMGAGPQNILLNTQQTLVNALQQQHQQHQQQQQQQQQQPQQQQIQLFQQILTQNGEIQNVPITLTQNNLNLLRMQMQGNITGQPQQVIIQQQPQIMQVSGSGNTNAGTSSGQTNQNPAIFLNQASIQQTNDKQGNIVNNFRSNC